MSISPKLSLPFLLPNQAQKHVTVNEGLSRLDALVQLTVRSASESFQPETPADGDAYALPDGAAGGEWSTFDPGNIAIFRDGGWLALTPGEGWRCWVLDTSEFLVFQNGVWDTVRGEATEVTLLGINTGEDPNNRLAVRALSSNMESLGIPFCAER